MPVIPHSPVAFRCKQCGRLHAGADAGELSFPTRCRVCDAQGKWEVLADATPERLAELGLSSADVAKHTPARKEDNLRAALQSCKDGLAHLEAKRAHWQQHKDSVVSEFQALDAKLAAVEEKIDALDVKDIQGFHKLQSERDGLDQQLKALQALEWQQRDLEHEAHLRADVVKHEAALAGAGAPGEPKTVMARAHDGPKTRDRS